MSAFYATRGGAIRNRYNAMSVPEREQWLRRAGMQPNNYWFGNLAEKPWEELERNQQWVLESVADEI